MVRPAVKLNPRTCSADACANAKPLKQRPAAELRNAAVLRQFHSPLRLHQCGRRAGEFLSAPSAPVTGFSFPNAIDTFSMTHCMRRKGLSYDRQHATTPGNCLGSMCRAQLRCRHFRLSSCTRQAQGGACRGRRRVEGLCKVCAKQRLERGLLAGIRDTSSRPG